MTATDDTYLFVALLVCLYLLFVGGYVIGFRDGRRDKGP